MKESLALLATHLRICIAEDESNGGEEIAFAGSIATDDHIVAGRERFYHSLVLVAVEPLACDFTLLRGDILPFEPLYNDLFDIHLAIPSVGSSLSLREWLRISQPYVLGFPRFMFALNSM